jgi:mRNA-degrading endonuclease RelE of RelBE toxin-antitoxin system
MQSELEGTVQVEFTPELKRNLRALSKKYHHIRSDIRKGKRSGYRLLYYLKSPKNVILITLYSKLDQSDISAREIKRIISEYDKSSSKPST